MDSIIKYLEDKLVELTELKSVAGKAYLQGTDNTAWIEKLAAKVEMCEEILKFIKGE